MEANAAVVEHARHEWEEGHRRLEAAATDPALYRRLLDEVEVLTDELRRRVGQTFTLAELAAAYGDADRWSREALAEQGLAADAHRHTATVEDAAFHAYSRGALDYSP